MAGSPVAISITPMSLDAHRLGERARRATLRGAAHQHRAAAVHHQAAVALVVGAHDGGRAPPPSGPRTNGPGPLRSTPGGRWLLWGAQVVAPGPACFLPQWNTR